MAPRLVKAKALVARLRKSETCGNTKHATLLWRYDMVYCLGTVLFTTCCIWSEGKYPSMYVALDPPLPTMRPQRH